MRPRTLAFAGAVSVALAGSQAASASDGATKGAAALQWIQGFDCPVPGQALMVGGLESQPAIDEFKRENERFLVSRGEALSLALRARQQIERETAASGKRSKRVQRAFADLDAKINNLGGQVTHALAQLAMAGYVEISNVSLSSPPTNRRHPLKGFVDFGNKLSSLATPYGPAAAVIPERWSKCLNEVNNAYIADFEAEILADVENTNNAPEISQIYDRWTLANTPNDSPVLQQVRSIQLTLIEEERRELARKRAERDAEARRMLQAQANRELRIANSYVGHIKAGRTQSAINLLTSDVYLSSPTGNARGRNAVARRMREAANQSAGASMTSPSIGSNYAISVRVRSSRGSGIMFFGFRDGQISSITLRRT